MQQSDCLLFISGAYKFRAAMPAKPLTPEQKSEANKLKKLFEQLQSAKREKNEPASQEELASLLPFGQSALAQYLGGKIPLNAEAVLAFAALLGVKPQTISPSIAEAEVSRAQRWLEAMGIAFPDPGTAHMLVPADVAQMLTALNEQRQASAWRIFASVIQGELEVQADPELAARTTPAPAQSQRKSRGQGRTSRP